MLTIFDSGLGGLSLWLKLAHSYPATPITYLADQLYNPYGDLDHRIIANRSLLAINYLINQGAPLIVIACNTVTVTCINTLRSHFNIPILAVEPPLKPLARLSAQAKTALITTTATFNSSRLKQLRNQFDTQHTITIFPTPALVPLIESAQTKKLYRTLRTYLSPLIPKNYRYLGLGCTHYSLISSAISQQISPYIDIIDPVQGVFDHLTQSYPQFLKPISTHHRFITTGDPAAFASTVKLLLGLQTTVEFTRL